MVCVLSARQERKPLVLSGLKEGKEIERSAVVFIHSKGTKLPQMLGIYSSLNFSHFTQMATMH